MARVHALGFFSKASSKFFYEVAPVALASVIGTVLINHYSHRGTEVVVQQAPPPPDAIVQTLHDEHQLIVDYLKRDAEAKQIASDEGSVAPLSPSLPPMKDAPAKRKVVSTEKGSARLRAKPEKSQGPLPLGPVLADPPASHESGTATDGLIEEGASVAGAVGGFVVAAWQYPARAVPSFSVAASAATWPFQWANDALRPHSYSDERR
jgi:hypothetical protein